MRGPGRGVVPATARVLLLVLVAGLGSCSWLGGYRESNPQVYGLHDRIPEGGGEYKVGKPYKIGGQWFHPQEDPNYDRTGTASWYGEYFHGRKTANGEWYDMNRLSAAHPTLPLPVYARVTNLDNGRSLVVRINDRGPFKRGRIIDLSKAAANQLGMLRAGTAPVRVTFISQAPLSGDVANMQAIDRGGGWTSPWWTASTEEGGEGTDGGVIPTVTGSTATGSTGSSPATEATAAAPTPIVPPGLYVQAASFRSEARARTLAGELAHLGSFAVIPAEIAGDTYYRVRLGPVASYAEAEGVVGSLEAKGVAGGRILSD